MSQSPAILLTELLEKPIGWTKHLIMHLNFGGGKGAASYAIHDAEGRTIEGIGFGYDTREGVRGFFMAGEESDGYLTWAELRAVFAKARAAHAEPRP